jgi:hypothetical protein
MGQVGWIGLDMLAKLYRLLTSEANFTEELKEAPAARKLQGTWNDLLETIREIGRSGDLSLIVATERAIVQSDHDRYANSAAMTSSLKTALNEIDVIEQHIAIVDDQDKYRAVDRAHSLPRNRKGGLPLDEARQALASHYARLTNMDKARLDDDEKRIIDARENNIFQAGKLYAGRQAKALGILLAQEEQRGNRP